MMTDKQQIEEMVKVIGVIRPEISHENGRERTVICMRNATNKEIAEALYNAGYRKVDENAVVLTEKEYNTLLAKLERYKNKKAWAVTKEVCEEYRKETAKDFIFKVESYLGYNDDNETFTKKELLLILAEVAKEQFGVEVE